MYVGKDNKEYYIKNGLKANQLIFAPHAIDNDRFMRKVSGSKREKKGIPPGAFVFIFAGKFEPKKYLSLLEQYDVNVLCCTPTEYRLMAKVDNLADYHLPTLHSAVSAGEPLNLEVKDPVKKDFNVDVSDGSGKT